MFNDVDLSPLFRKYPPALPIDAYEVADALGISVPDAQAILEKEPFFPAGYNEVGQAQYMRFPQGFVERVKVSKFGVIRQLEAIQEYPEDYTPEVLAEGIHCAEDRIAYLLQQAGIPVETALKVLKEETN